MRRGEHHQPTERQRGEVTALAAAGYTQTQIAEYIGISDRTLRKHYARELKRAAMTMIGAAVQGLYKAVIDREAWAICFLLKTRAKHLGWSERLEVTGRDGEPLIDVKRLSDDELSALEAIVRKSAIAAADRAGEDATRH